MSVVDQHLASYTWCVPVIFTYLPDNCVIDGDEVVRHMSLGFTSVTYLKVGQSYCDLVVSSYFQKGLLLPMEHFVNNLMEYLITSYQTFQFYPSSLYYTKIDTNRVNSSYYLQ